MPTRDALGNVTQGTLPTGTAIDDVIDGRIRRIRSGNMGILVVRRVTGNYPAVFNRLLKKSPKASNFVYANVSDSSTQGGSIVIRGSDTRQEGLFSYVSPETRIPRNHLLREIRRLTDEALSALTADFEAAYSPMGQPSIAPEKLIRHSIYGPSDYTRSPTGRIDTCSLIFMPIGVSHLANRVESIDILAAGEEDRRPEQDADRQDH